MPGLGVGETASRMRLDGDATVSRGCGRQTRHRAVQPVGDGSQGVVVEGGHLVWVDRAVWPEAIPALPDGGCTHRHWVEPGRAALLLEQVICGVVLSSATQGITDQRRPHEAGVD